MDCSSFIQGLCWLQPDISNSILSIDNEYRPHLPTHIKTDKVSFWLYRNVEDHRLSQKLSWLLSDKEHLLNCYNNNAFMCQEKYTEATLICLRALERSEPSLISDIDPCLFLYFNKSGGNPKVHRRCSSFPGSSNFSRNTVPARKLSCKQLSVTEVNNKNVEVVSNNKVIYGKLKPWRSLPNLRLENVKLRRRSATVVKHSSTVPSSPLKTNAIELKPTQLSPSMLKIDYSNTGEADVSRKRKTDKIINNRKHIRLRETVKEFSPPSAKMSTKSLPCNHYKSSEKLYLALDLVRSAPDYTFSVLPGEKDYTKRPQKSFIEDGGSSVLPMSTGYFPRPSKGQTLTSFLSSGQFSRANAELDRENAHFSISETMIAVIEQIKWKRELKLNEEQVEESDEEINSLKQRIRLRRRQKQLEKQRRLWSASLLSDGRTDSKYYKNIPICAWILSSLHQKWDYYISRHFSHYD